MDLGLSGFRALLGFGFFEFRVFWVKAFRGFGNFGLAARA